MIRLSLLALGNERRNEFRIHAHGVAQQAVACALFLIRLGFAVACTRMRSHGDAPTVAPMRIEHHVV
jgi:hypothetical protein